MTFTRSTVAACARLVTINATGGAPGEARTANGSAGAIIVSIVASDGTGAVDRDFSIAVFC